MAVKKLPGVTDVVDVTAETLSRKGLPGSDWNCRCQNILAISSGKGGGQSTVAVNVAVASLSQEPKSVYWMPIFMVPTHRLCWGFDSAQITVRQGEQGEVLEPALITASNWFQWAFN